MIATKRVDTSSLQWALPCTDFPCFNSITNIYGRVDGLKVMDCASYNAYGDVQLVLPWSGQLGMWPMQTTKECP